MTLITAPDGTILVSNENDFAAEVDAHIARIREIRQQIRERPAMKYALESMRDMIGAQDFKDLCLLFDWHEVDDAPLKGEDFARCVREAAFRKRHRSQVRLESQKQSVI
jgi:hypothetical protein